MDFVSKFMYVFYFIFLRLVPLPVFKVQLQFELTTTPFWLITPLSYDKNYLTSDTSNSQSVL